jgi:hypothetical protein
MDEAELIAMLAPIAVLQILLAVLALWDIRGQSKTRYVSRPIWAVVVIIFGVIGPLLYFLLGREQ